MHTDRHTSGWLYKKGCPCHFQKEKSYEKIKENI